MGTSEICTWVNLISLENFGFSKSVIISEYVSLNAL